MNKPNTTPTPTGSPSEEQHEGRGLTEEQLQEWEERAANLHNTIFRPHEYPNPELSRNATIALLDIDNVVPRLVDEVRRLRQASRANIEEELASVLLDTQAQLEEARASLAVTEVIVDAVRGLLNVSTPNARSRYMDALWLAIKALDAEPQPTVAQATVPETEGGREEEHQHE